MEEIVLIGPNECHAYTVGASVVYYTRVPSSAQQRIANECTTRRGRLDVEAFNQLLLKRAIKGWKGVKDPMGKVPEAHDPQGSPPELDTLTGLIQRLPGDVVADLSNLTTAASEPEENVLGN